MNFYKHSIGDYRRDTAHLSFIEHGIYRQLIDTYYLDEKPLTSDLQRLMRSQCVRNADEEQALKNVLADFFELTEYGYVHKRCEVELQSIYAKSDKARESAKARWCNKNNDLQDTDANAMRTHSERNANGMLPTTHYPEPKRTTSVDDESPTVSPEPDRVSLLFDYWKEVMESPKSKLDAKRRRVISQALKVGYSVEELKLAIEGCKSSEYHMGKNERATKYNSVELIFRNADKIDAFISLSPGGSSSSSAKPFSSKALFVRSDEEQKLLDEENEKRRIAFEKMIGSASNQVAA